jgi:serralysin
LGSFVIDGFDNFDDVISTSAGGGDTLVSSTYGGNDRITLFSAQFLIHFGEGNDTLSGGPNGGTAYGEGGNDRLWSNAYGGTHNLYGGEGDDDIWPFAAVDGGATLANGYGGAGHDTFRESTPLDVTNNWYGGTGFDVVRNYGSQGVALTLNGTGTAAGATGSTYLGVEGATGAAGDDTLSGSGGDNLLIGGNGSDRLSGGAGNDFLIGEERSDDFLQAYRGIKANFVTTDALDPLNSNAAGTYASDGGTQADSLYGGGGNDVMSGGGGADLLNGGAGRDWATYLSADGSVALNLQTGGTAGHAAGDSYVQVENVQGSDFSDTIAGTGGNNELRGMSGDDSLTGRAGNDTLVGGEGRDTLTGGSGSDVLTGGNAEDVFVFGAGAMDGVDTITDMQVNFDEIRLSRAEFAGIGVIGSDMYTNRFVTGTAALDELDRIIYDSATGALMYDGDGDGAGLAVQFAQLATGLALTAADILVIA